MIKKSFRLGLTGPTGSGKSTAAKAALAWGARIVDADQVARQVVQPGTPCLEELAEAFGRDILLPDGTLQRALLARRAFSSPELTKQLNAITHPWITREVERQIEAFAKEESAIIVLDAPLLYESGEDVLCDAVAVVTAPAEIRLRRIMQRDGINLEQARQRISAQPEQEFYTQKADYILDGSGQPDRLYQATYQLLDALREDQHDKRNETPL